MKNKAKIKQEQRKYISSEHKKEKEKRKVRFANSGPLHCSALACNQTNQEESLKHPFNKKTYSIQPTHLFKRPSLKICIPLPQSFVLKKKTILE